MILKAVQNKNVELIQLNEQLAERNNFILIFNLKTMFIILSFSYFKCQNE